MTNTGNESKVKAQNKSTMITFSINGRKVCKYSITSNTAYFFNEVSEEDLIAIAKTLSLVKSKIKHTNN